MLKDIVFPINIHIFVISHFSSTHSVLCKEDAADEQDDQEQYCGIMFLFTLEL